MAIAAFGKLNLEEAPPFTGQVYKAKDIETNEIVALKKIRMDKSEEEGLSVTAIREIKILSKLRHENITHLKEIVISSGEEEDNQVEPDNNNKYKGGIYMVFEYMDHDLAGLVNRPRLKFTVPQIKCYMKQLLTGLHVCHVNRVLHRDIKGSNILIDNEGNLKLGGFEFARIYSQEQTENRTYQVTTLHYRAPEVLLGSSRYGPAIDIWSVGCVFAELLHGKPILPGRTEFGRLKKIYELCGSPDENNWPGVSELAWYSRYKSPRPMKRRTDTLMVMHLNYWTKCWCWIRHREYLQRMLLILITFGVERYRVNQSVYESSHEFQIKKMKSAKKQKLF